MPNVAPIQASFNGGEISPLLYGRVDVPRYKECLAICQNYLPLIQGPKTRRPGSAFVFPVKTSSLQTRLIPFEFSTVQAYMLEFGNGYVRIYKNNGIVTNSGFSITGVTQANPAVVTATGHTYVGGEHIVINGVSGMTELDNREFTVSGVSGSTFTLVDNITSAAVNSTGYVAYASGGTVSQIYETYSPYLTADIPTIQYTQSNDILYLVHPKYPPQKLQRFADNSWTMAAVANQDGPYYDENIQFGTTMTLTHVVSGVHYWQISASAISDINGGLGFQATDVGRVIRVKDGTVWNWFTIYQVDSTTVVRITFPGTNLVNGSTSNVLTGDVCSDWRLGLWNGLDGYPTTVTFHQGRLVFAGAGGKPTRFDGSNTGSYEAFAPTDQSGTIAANHSYGFPLAANDVNGIRWLTSDEQGLLMGTTGGEWLVTSADPNSALSALSVNAKRTTSHGCESVQAVQSGKCTLFVQRGGRKLRELNYYFDVNGFRAADLTQMAEHITQSRLTYLAVQKIPQPIVWAVRTDGVLVAMTYERDLDALKVGWSRHVMGGSSVKVESVAVIPSADTESQDVWLIVNRQVNGQTVRYVEYLTQIFDNNSALTSAFFLDSGLTYNGSSTSTISGLNHLNGQSVSIIADGGVQSNRTVTNGRITLDIAASIVTVGLQYNSDGQKLRTDAGSADGTAMGKTRRTHRVGILLYNTLGLQLGPDFNTLDTLTLDDNSSLTYGVAQPLFSGITTQLITTNYDFDNMICWRQNQPLPGTILGFYPQMVTQDRG